MKGVKVKAISGLLVSTMLLSACVSDPYTRESKASNTVKYGAIGAVVCGLIGSRDSSKHARNAALGCGVIGASIGAYMDSQETKLRQSLENTGVSVQREGNQIRLIMPGNITFDTNKSMVKSQFYPVLDSVVTVLREFDETIIEVQGFTDSTGGYEHNIKLSESRARQVANYLEQGNILSQRLMITGKGPANPIASNDTAQGRSQNRRVEIRIRAIERS